MTNPDRESDLQHPIPEVALAPDLQGQTFVTLFIVHCSSR